MLDLYNQYYKLLEQKYGNAQQFYTPKVINVDQPVGNGKTETVQKEQAIGNPDFLKELQNGEAFLYATFENGKVGAALSVNVDGSGQSYITVEYKTSPSCRPGKKQPWMRSKFRKDYNND